MAHRRGPWSQHEDACLMQLVSDQGPLNWVRIAQTLGTRTPKQCRERFHQNLKPTLNHEPITAEEGVQIEILVNELGKRWAEIARRLHGRSDNAVKNWWNGNQNRRKRHDRRRGNHSHGNHDDGRYPLHSPHQQHRSLSLHQGSGSLPLANRYLSSPTSPAYPVGGYSRHQNGSSLPSPSSTASPRSDALDADHAMLSDSGSSYTTSPHEHYTRVSPTVQLPPLRIPVTCEALPRSLPGVGSLLHAAGEGRDISIVGTCLPPPSSHLPTAPCSPTEDHRSSRRYFGQVEDKDSRMTVDQLVNR